MGAQNILWVINEKSEVTSSENSRDFNDSPGIKIHLLYMVSDVSLAALLPSVAWLDMMWMDDAHRKLGQLQKVYGNKIASTQIAYGNVKRETKRYAKKLQCDVIRKENDLFSAK